MVTLVAVPVAENEANVEPNDTNPAIDCKPPCVVTVPVTEINCKLSSTIDAADTDSLPPTQSCA